MKVYIAGPYGSSGTWGQNLHAAIYAAERVHNAGHTPFIPHTHTALWDLMYPKHNEMWIEFDLKWLDECDALIRLDGESQGADAEVHYAYNHCIDVFDSVEDFVDEEAVRPLD